MNTTQIMWADGTIKTVEIERQAFTIVREAGESDEDYEKAILAEIHEECKKGWIPTSYQYIDGERHENFVRYIYKGEG